MSSFVLDSSLALSWGLPGEATDDTLALLARVELEGAVVPALWHIEVTNVVALKERSGVLQSDRTHALLEALTRLPIETDHSEVSIADGSLLAVMRSTGLTAYDAMYFDLASRKGLALATLDRKLRLVCLARGIAVLPEVIQA